jgi:hypothetical protein
MFNIISPNFTFIGDQLKFLESFNKIKKQIEHTPSLIIVVCTLLFPHHIMKYRKEKV